MNDNPSSLILKYPSYQLLWMFYIEVFSILILCLVYAYQWYTKVLNSWHCLQIALFTISKPTSYVI